MQSAIWQPFYYNFSSEYKLSGDLVPLCHVIQCVSQQKWIIVQPWSRAGELHLIWPPLIAYNEAMKPCVGREAPEVSDWKGSSQVKRLEGYLVQQLLTHLSQHDEFMAWQCFQYYWPFVRGICWRFSDAATTASSHSAWWAHGMAVLSVLLALCEGNLLKVFWCSNNCLISLSMMSSWHGSAFSITGPLWGESAEGFLMQQQLPHLTQHDELMAWQCFQYYWPFVRGIFWSSGPPFTKMV